MKIIIDFDDTIFNTYLFMQELIEYFKRAGFTSEEFKEIYKKSKEKKKDFDLKTVISLFSELKSFDKEQVIEGIDLLLERSEEFLYPDFRKFANKFMRSDLILLSFGTTEFQGKKIENSKVKNLFKKVIITQNDKVEKIEYIYKKYPVELVIFIDDKAEEIDKVKEKFPEIITMKMERPRGGHVKIKSEKTDYVINNFAQEEKIIKKITEKNGSINF